MEQTIITPCHSGGCVAITKIGNDWFRIFSTHVPGLKIAVTGEELRSFFDAVKAGTFDELATLAEAPA